MNWSDEQYVKLYTRDTLTWKSWHWQARTVFMHLARKVDHSGFIETGTMTPGAALSLQLDLPVDVVEAGLAQLIGCGTCEVLDRSVFLVKFVEAQEARKTEAQKKRDFRERAIARRRQASEIPRPHVPSVEPVGTGWNRMEPSGTQMDPPAKPSPAQLSPALKSLAGEKPPAEPKPPKPRKPERPPDPRHAPMVAALVEVYEEHNLGAAYDFGGRDAKAVTLLLAKSDDDEEILYRWRVALRRSADKYQSPKTKTLYDLVEDWNHYPVVKDSQHVAEARL